MSKFLRHDRCPKCGSDDNLAVYDDHSYCFSQGCDYRTKKGGEPIYDHDDDDRKPKPMYPLPEEEQRGVKARGLLAATVNRYKVTVRPKDNIEVIFPRFDAEGQHVANQVRGPDKQFYSQGQPGKAVLFGQHLFPAGGKNITVTEGYYDAMSTYQMTGSRYPNVGVQSASSAKKEVVDNFEYLNSFGEIIFAFDNDEPGQKAAKEVAQLFEPGKVKLLKLTKGKDPSDYLQQGMGSEYTNEWFRAATFMPDGLLLGTDMWEDIKNHKTPHSVPYPWDGMNYKTYGIRLSEMVLLTADTGVGKTSVVKEIEYSLLMNEELKAAGMGVGFLHLEEPKYDTAIGLMSIHANKPFHLPDTDKTEEELRSAYDAVINTPRVVIYDHFGSNDIDLVLAKVRHMAALGCKYIVVDHLSIIVSDQAGDERKQLDEISTKIKTLTMNLNIAVICIIHINRQGQVRGSAGPEQVSNIVVRLERDKKAASEWRRNVMKITVEKNRFCGRTGPACYLFYNQVTNRLEELSPELVEEYEKGGSGAGNEFAAYGG